MSTSKQVAVPDEVRVGPVSYRVILDAAAIKAASDADSADGTWIAYSDHNDLIICLNPEHARDANRSSLVHEILHCLVRQSGAHPNTYADITYEARDRNGGYTVEEYIVAALTGPLLSVLRDNPQLVAYLLS